MALGAYWRGCTSSPDDRAYTRSHIRSWLSEWPEYFQTDRAESTLGWVQVKADLLQAVRRQHRCLQETFLLVGVRQMEIGEAAEAMGIPRGRAWLYWEGLVSEVMRLLMDRTVCEGQECEQRAQMRPEVRCCWWEPVGPRCC